MALIRIPGTGVFLNRGRVTVPLAMRANVEHLRVLHQQVVIVSVETQPIPAVADAEIAVIDDLGYRDDGITHVTTRFGYMQRTSAADCRRRRILRSSPRPHRHHRIPHRRLTRFGE
jgi:KUP system potassium uptake protein